MIFLEMDFFLEPHGHLEPRLVPPLLKFRLIIQAEEGTVTDGFLLLAAIMHVFLRH